MKADAIAAKLKNKDTVEFWRKVTKLNNKKAPAVNTVDGCTGSQDIANMWGVHFMNIFNSVQNSTDRAYVMDGINGSLVNWNVTSHDIDGVIKQLKVGKSPGADQIHAEHLIYASHRLKVLLSILCTSIVNHGYVPSQILDVMITPIIKNKTGDTSDKNNYRPIAIATVFSKVLELLIMGKIECFLYTSDNQFGFKKNHGTDMCIHAFRQTIEYYKLNSGPVFICFLDATKAFDRVNHWCLFKKLINRKVPLHIVKLMVFWFQTQRFSVQWNGCKSIGFTASNGVPQGGIISPLLFNVYIDDLSVLLSKSNIGCNFGEKSVNHFSYADDMAVLSPSASGLQKLLDICSIYAIEHNIIYNTTKTLCMVIQSSKFKLLNIPSLYINNVKLQYVDSYKYLGMYIHVHNDDLDILRQLRSVILRSNILLRTFHRCSTDVKLCLFQSYCANMYCSHLWFNFTKRRMNRLRVSYNNSMRRLFNLHYRCSASAMFVYGNISSFGELRRKYIYNFIQRINCSSNSIIQCLTVSTSVWRCPIWRHWYTCLYV